MDEKELAKRFEGTGPAACGGLPAAGSKPSHDAGRSWLRLSRAGGSDSRTRWVVATVVARVAELLRSRNTLEESVGIHIPVRSSATNTDPDRRGG